MKFQKLCVIAIIAVSVFLAGMPRQAYALNEVAGSCQLPSAYLTETGLERLVRTGVASIATAALNPIDDFTTRQKKKIQKAATMLGIGVTLMTLCPPLVVPDGFSDLPRDERVDFAIDNRFDPIGIAEMNFDVDNPADPGSCTADLAVQINGSGKLTEGGDFPELEFVYVEPFGSFPSAKDLYEGVAERIQELVESAFNNILPNLEPIEDVISGVEDFTNTIDNFLTSLGVNFSLADLIPGIDGYILDLIGLAIAPDCDSVGLECQFRQPGIFDLWGTDLPQLRDAGTISSTAQGFAFPDGPSVVQFDSEINTGFSTEIRYDQDIFIKEYFEPEFDVLFTEADPGADGMVGTADDGPDLNIVAEFVFEALEPGQADTSFTPPSFQQGSIAVTDNCDPNPSIRGGFGREIPIGGPYYPRVSASDRALNITGRPESDAFCNGVATDPSNPDPRCKKYAIKVTVVDTIPPDLSPADPIGIPVADGLTQVLFTDTGVGCTEFNCQQLRPDAQLFPPPVFDFATLQPSYTCFASNSAGMDQACDLPAVLPVGEVTTVRWVSSDPDGNAAETVQFAALREQNTNQPPIAAGSAITVAANTPTSIELIASDPEFDPLSFAVTSLPTNGSLTVTPEAEFQTRFSASGTISNLTDTVRVVSQDHSVEVFADPDGQRLVALDEVVNNGDPGISDALYFDTLIPDSLAFRSGDIRGPVSNDEIFSATGSPAESMLVGDWTTSGGRIHGLVQSPNTKGGLYSPDSGFDISAVVSNPAHFELEGNFLFITDPDPDNSLNGQLHVIELGDASISPASWSQVSSRTINLGFNASGISRVDPQNCVDADAGEPFEYVVSDWDNGELHRLVFSDQASPVEGGSTEPTVQTWDVSARLTDPDGTGPNRANILDPRDIARMTLDCRSAAEPIAINVVDSGNKNLDEFELTFPPAPISASTGLEPAVASEFSQINAVEALSDSDLVTLERARIARFDLFGNLKSNIQTYERPNRNALNGSANGGLRPLDGSFWSAMDTDDNGNVFLLSFSSPNSDTQRISATKISIADGHNNFTQLAEEELEIPEPQSSDQGRALAFSSGTMSASSDDVVYAFTTNGMERLSATTLASTVLFDVTDSPNCTGLSNWCQTYGNEFPDLELMDMDTDGMGNLYISDASTQRVHKLASDGTHLGWLGRCDSGTGCDNSLPLAERRSLGFSCNASSCQAASGTGNEAGQFTFVIEQLDQDKPRPSSGVVNINLNSSQVYVTDNPDNGSGNVPRIQIFDLSGTFVSETVPDGNPDNLLEFLEPGETNSINDLSTTADSLFVIEDLPLKRLHVFDINPFQVSLGGARVEYTPSTDFEGPDSFTYIATDSFSGQSNQATVTINVQLDTQPPTITNCPAPITVEATRIGLAAPATMTQGDTGSRELALFLEGRNPPYDDPSNDISISDDTTTPAPTFIAQPATFGNLFPVNATTSVAFTALDALGNFTNCLSSVTVVDTVAPTLEVPADLVAEATGPFSSPDLGAAMVNDVGGATLTLEGVPPAGFPAPRGGRTQTTTVTYRATDSGGNQASGTQEVTIVDTVPPLLSAADITVAAINGHTNPYTIAQPTATDAVGIDGPVACQPALSGSVAAIPLDVICLARDLSGNVGRTGFTYTIEQVNGDGDAFVDLIDPTPSVSNNADVFSDVPLGGTTSGTYQAAGSGDFLIIDAYLESQGVRAQWTASDAGSAANISTLTLCDGSLTVTEFDVVLDEIGNVDTNAVSITCSPSTVRNHLGKVEATWELPNGTSLVSQMPPSLELSVEGFVAAAALENTGPIDFLVSNNTVSLDPGQSIDVESLTNFSPVSSGIDDVSLSEDGLGIQINLADSFSDQEDPTSALQFAVSGNSISGLLNTPQVSGSTLTLTPAPDAFGTSMLTVTATDTLGAEGSTQFQVTVIGVNDAPLLLLTQSSIVVDEDAGPVVVAVADPVTPGPSNENDQSLNIVASNNNTNLFSTQPVLGVDGVVTFAAFANESGSAAVTFTASDSGGTAMDGIDTSSAGITVTVNPVNDPPTFVLGNSLSFADATPRAINVPAFVSDISAGPADEAGQALMDFQVQSLGEVSDVVSDAEINTAGDLQFSLTGNSGSQAFAVALQDDGGVQNDGQDISEPRVFSVVVGGGEVDLSISVVSLDDVALAGGILAHQVTAANVGQTGVAGALVSLNLPSQLSNPRISCAEPQSCTSDQDNNVSLTLQPAQSAQFTLISGVQVLPEELITLIVEIAPPNGLSDVDISNNRSEVSTQMILFASGFEE